MGDNKTVYGRTGIGQFIYDFGFANLTDRWLARKHKVPLSKVQEYRRSVKRGLRKQKQKQRTKP